MELTRTEQMLLQAICASNKGKQVSWTDVSDEQWEDLMQLAQQHKLQPLVVQAAYSCPAAAKWEKFELQRRSAKQQMLLQAAKTEAYLSLCKSFSEAGLTVLTVKGILCRDLYENGDLRQSSDEDLYAAEKDFLSCCELLCSLGYEQVEKKDPETADEISWAKAGSPLRLELHRRLFNRTTDAVKDLQLLFDGVFAAPEQYHLKNGATVFSMPPQEHLLYLLLHAYKHFIRCGFGIRQACDIGKWAVSYNARIDWEALFRQCEELKILRFVAAVFRICDEFLGITPELSDTWKAVRTDGLPMLYDMLKAGIYGTSSQNRLHAAPITQNAVSAKKTNRRSGILRSVFPSRESLQEEYPELKEHGILLPVVWGKRMIAYRKRAKINGGESAAETIRIAKERKKLLQFYDII